MFSIKKLFTKISGNMSDNEEYNTISGEDLPKNDEFRQENEDNWSEKFPWNDVKSCLKDKLDNKKFKGHRNCPKCGRYSEELVWIMFNSPPWTWRNLCGRKGPLSICPNCKIQVDFLCEVMN
jgi:hypothetical protein